MKNIYKKIAAVGAGLTLCTAAMAQSTATPILRFLPLLSGYNVLCNTGVVASLNVTNLLNTTYNGQALYTLTNNVVNGVLQSNTVAPDAFKMVTLAPDINGDIVANASVCILVGNTNLIPISVTNAYGQYFVTNWPLAVSQTPNWMYPATTNAYPAFTGSATNALTVTLYRTTTMNPQGGNGPTLGPTFPLTETTASFSFTVTPNGTTPVCVITNLPVSWLQGAKQVYASIVSSTTGAGTAILVNQLGILQPQ
jgi:hypothetical protein